MGVAATLFGVQHLKGIEQRRSGAAQWLPGPRSIGQKDFPFRTIKSLLLLLLLLSTVQEMFHEKAQNFKLFSIHITSFEINENLDRISPLSPLYD